MTDAQIRAMQDADLAERIQPQPEPEPWWSLALTGLAFVAAVGVLCFIAIIGSN